MVDERAFASKRHNNNASRNAFITNNTFASPKMRNVYSQRMLSPDHRHHLQRASLPILIGLRCRSKKEWPRKRGEERSRWPRSDSLIDLRFSSPSFQIQGQHAPQIPGPRRHLPFFHQSEVQVLQSTFIRQYFHALSQRHPDLLSSLSQRSQPCVTRKASGFDGGNSVTARKPARIVVKKWHFLLVALWTKTFEVSRHPHNPNFRLHSAICIPLMQQANAASAQIPTTTLATP